MNSLFAVVFDDRASADAALGDLAGLQRGQVLALHDAVFVTRTADGGVRLDQSVNIAAAGALSGAFWGSLVGLIFLSPLLGAAVGAAAGGVSGYLTDYGINDDFARQMGERLEPGRVALFVLASDVTPEKVAEALRPRGGELFYSSFAPEVEQRFRQGIRGASAGQQTPAHLTDEPASAAAAAAAAVSAVQDFQHEPRRGILNEQSKTDDQQRKFASAGEATPRDDVTAPTTDDELNDALEDTFPASDPINFAGSSAGRSAENAENPPVKPSANPPVGTHPLGGANDRDLDDAAADVGGDADNRRTRP